MPNSIATLDWLVLIAYAVLLVGISLYHSRKLKTQDDVLLAGRSMSRWPIALSMYMALFSTNTFVATTGWLSRPDGTIWIGLRNIGMMTAVPLVVWLYPALFFRLRISTAYEYLEKRFSWSVRLLAALFFLAFRVTWMATMLYSSGLVLSMLLGWTAAQGHPRGQEMAMCLVAVLGTSFALAGGMHAIIWTDVAQFFIMMGGVVTMGVYATLHSGGIVEVVHQAVDAGKFSRPALFSLTDELSMVSALLLGFIDMLSSSGSDQVVLQTYLTARSESEAKKSLWRNGLILKPLSLIFPVLGVFMFVYYQGHPDVAARMRVPDDALSVFIVHVLPAGLRGLMVVAILSAVVDSIASGMAASSAVVQVDFLQRFRRRTLSDRANVRIVRALIAGWSILIMLTALWIHTLGARNSIIQILNKVMYPFSGVLLGVFLLGIITRRAHARGVLVGAMAGFAAAVSGPLCRHFLESTSTPGHTGLTRAMQHLAQLSSFYIGAAAVIVTFGAGYLVSRILPPATPITTAGLTRLDLPPAPDAAPAQRPTPPLAATQSSPDYQDR